MASATATRTAASRTRHSGMQGSPHTPGLQEDGAHAAPISTTNAGGPSPMRRHEFAQAGPLDRLSHPLLITSDTAFKALLIVPLLVWWAAVLAGAWVYEGLPKGQKVYHAMLWFDKGILRPAGALVPFVVVLLRAAAHVADYQWRRRSLQGPTAAAKKRHQASMQLGSLALSCLVIYSGVAIARLAIYFTHYFLLSQRYLEFHIVSDHIFLAATMLICLHTEVVCLMSDLLRVEQRLADVPEQQGSFSLFEVVLALLMVLAMFLYLFTAADMYYTAKHYHFPLESVTTTVLVFIMFQCPMLVWMIKKRQRMQPYNRR